MNKEDVNAILKTFTKEERETFLRQSNLIIADYAALKFDELKSQSIDKGIVGVAIGLGAIMGAAQALGIIFANGAKSEALAKITVQVANEVQDWILDAELGLAKDEIIEADKYGNPKTDGEKTAGAKMDVESFCLLFDKKIEA